MKSSKISLALFLTMVLVASVFAQSTAPDALVIGTYVSANTGTKIQITPAPADTTTEVLIQMPGNGPLRALLKEDRHNTIAVYFALDDGTPISGHYFPSEKVLRLTDQGEAWDNWDKL